MKRLALLAASATLVLGVFSACSPADESPSVTAPEIPVVETTPPPAADMTLDVLRSDGIGPLTIGMTKAEVVAAVGDTRTPDAVGGPEPESCEEFRPQRAPDDVLVMIVDGKLARISLVDMSTVKTDKGLGLGDTADAVKTSYGDQAKTTPHKYQDKPAEYITWWVGGPRSEPYVEDETARGIVYEIDGTGKVGAVHAGGPSIQYVEGCA